MEAQARLLGPPEVRVGDKSFEPPPGKTSALLYYLAYKGEWVGRDELVYLFWPEADESTARKNLRQLLSTLRRLPYTQELEVEDTRLRWRVLSDVSALKQALEANDQVQAAQLYGGELLQGYKLPELPEFEEWLELERQELQGRHRGAVLSLAGELLASDRHAQAADVLASYRKHDPLDEEVLRRLLHALHRSGQRERALEAFKTFQQALERELGGEPEESTLRLVAEITASTDESAAPAQPRHNLPAPPTPLLGREAERISLIEHLLDPACRLLTLTGPGGIGKTRLSIEVASALAELKAFTGGVWFVSLSTIATPELLVSAIADALKFSFYGPTDPKEQLLDYLRDKELLLVLDNFEQLLAAAPLVAELLATCAHVKALVTSREALRVRGEREFEVPPLVLPDLKHLPPFERLSQYAAVELFIQRAVAVRPDFGVTNENAPAVAEICHRLDGLPLAIELAAARTKLFSPQAMLARLASVTGGPLKLLAGGARDLPERQQTLRNTIAWSYDLLEPEEQTLFARLSVFVGGRTLDAIEAVCNIENDLDVLSSLASLVDKSMVRQQEVEAEPRFFMLVTIHEYAREKLEASGEADNIRRNHAEFFLKLAEEAEPQLQGEQQTTWLARLEEEHDNFRAALEWTLEQNEAEIGLRLAGALGDFWDLRGYVSEGRRWLEAVLAKSDGVPTTVRAKGLLETAVLVWLQADYVLSASLLKTSLALYEKLGDKKGAAQALHTSGIVSCFQGDFTEGQVFFEKSLVLRKELGDKQGIASTLSNLGNIAGSQGDFARATLLKEEALEVLRVIGDSRRITQMLIGLGSLALDQGDYTRAGPLYEQALIPARELGDKQSIAIALANQGLVASSQGEYERAIPMLEESLALAKELDDKHISTTTLGALGEIAHDQGNDAKARSLYRESLTIRYEVGSKEGIAISLAAFGDLAVQQEPERAARLFSAVDVLREAIGALLPPRNRSRYERNVAATRSQLSEAAFRAAWAAGRVLTLEQAVAYALEHEPPQQ